MFICFTKLHYLTFKKKCLLCSLLINATERNEWLSVPIVHFSLHFFCLLCVLSLELIGWVNGMCVHMHTHTCLHTHHLSHNLNLVGQPRRRAISQITLCQNHRSYFLLYFYGSLASGNHIAQDKSVSRSNFHTLQNISFKPSMKFSSTLQHKGYYIV